jgi:hypothetical protein
MSHQCPTCFLFVFWFFVFFFFFETESHYVVQAGLELSCLLTQASQMLAL